MKLNAKYCISLHVYIFLGELSRACITLLKELHDPKQCEDHKFEHSYKSLNLHFLNMKLLYDLVVINMGTGFQRLGSKFTTYELCISGQFIQAF